MKAICALTSVFLSCGTISWGDKVLGVLPCLYHVVQCYGVDNKALCGLTNVSLSCGATLWRRQQR